MNGVCQTNKQSIQTDYTNDLLRTQNTARNIQESTNQQQQLLSSLLKIGIKKNILFPSQCPWLISLISQKYHQNITIPGRKYFS